MASLLVPLCSCSSAPQPSSVDAGARSGTGPSMGSGVGPDMDATGSITPALNDDSSSTSPANEASTAAVPEASSNSGPDFAACPANPPSGDFPLDVAAVLMGVCQHCHKNPPANHAPFELLNYEDVLLPIGGLPRWQDMYKVIQPGSVPHMPPPTVPPLTAAQLKTLSDWLGACAVPVPEGTGGDVDRDAAAPSGQTDATTTD